MKTGDAEQLIGQIRQELSVLDAQIRNHPYIAAIEDGRVSVDSLRGFAGHQYHIIGSDLRSVALLINRHSTLPGRRFLSDLLQG
jgi:hypothetical protein